MNATNTPSSNTITPQQAQSLVQSYYSVLDAARGDVSVLDSVLSADWKNHASNGSFADRKGFVSAVMGMRQAVPDLNWRIDEVLLTGDRVVVRGQGSGTPRSEFFGVPTTGRSFSIMSIDIHTVRDGRIASSFHLEDWAGAIQQLLAR